MYPINSADDLTQRRRPKWLIRTGFSAGGNMHPFGSTRRRSSATRRSPSSRSTTRSAGRSPGAFHKTFEDNGGQIIQKLWVPLNVQDYAPYLAQVRRDADAVFVLALGRWTLLFAKQYADSGLKDRIPLIAGGTYTDEHVLPQLGDESIGVISAHHYSAALDTPANRRFAPRSRRSTAARPRLLGELLHRRPCRRRGRPRRGRPRRGSRGLHWPRSAPSTSPTRPAVRSRMDPYGNPTQNIYIRKVERVGGKLQNTVIHTYPNVSQFWKYDPRSS